MSKDPTSTYDDGNLRSMPVVDLQRICQSCGLIVCGRKAEILERIFAFRAKIRRDAKKAIGKPRISTLAHCLLPIAFLASVAMGDDASLLDAIRQVESGGNVRAVGDGGRARGAYQIHREYWADACRFGHVRWSYDRYVTSDRNCRQVIRWYWQMHHVSTASGKSRLHNQGRGGMNNRAAWRYWARVQAEIQNGK